MTKKVGLGVILFAYCVACIILWYQTFSRLPRELNERISKIETQIKVLERRQDRQEIQHKIDLIIKDKPTVVIPEMVYGKDHTH